MKNLVLAALASLVLTAGPVSARADDGKSGADQKPRAEWAAKMKQRLKERLDLSDEQADKLEAAMKSSRDAMKPLWEKARAADRKLSELVSAGTDAEVAAALKDADAARKDLTSERAKLEESLASILKPRQLAKLRVERERMRHRRFAMMRPGRHHRGEERDARWGGEKSCSGGEGRSEDGKSWSGRKGRDGDFQEGWSKDAGGGGEEADGR
jgi:Spy/CpxP family protein refolding chaperone